MAPARVAPDLFEASVRLLEGLAAWDGELAWTPQLHERALNALQRLEENQRDSAPENRR
jgi:hypothetical protein